MDVSALIRPMDADEVVDLVVGVDGLSGVAPEPVQHVVLHLAALDVPVVDVGDLQLAAAGRPQRGDDLEDALVVEVNAGDHVVRGGGASGFSRMRTPRPWSSSSGTPRWRRWAGSSMRARTIRAPSSWAMKLVTAGRRLRSNTLSASRTTTRSPSTKRSVSPRASAMPPGRSWEG